jgi:uncharacterized membrane protein YgdD (TMEM256/DUF423 family)
MSDRNWLIVFASGVGMASVAVGAFGAHGADPRTAEWLREAARFGLFSTALLLFLAVFYASREKASRWMLFLAILVALLAPEIVSSLPTGLPPKEAGWLTTAARYSAFHALAILMVTLMWRYELDIMKGTRIAFLLGIVLFGGSLVTMAYGAPRWFGAITPVGGLAFIVGWGMLASAGFRRA